MFEFLQLGRILVFQITHFNPWVHKYIYIYLIKQGFFLSLSERPYLIRKKRSRGAPRGFVLR